LGTLRRATRRYTFGNSIKVIDLGLRLNDVRELDLEAEQAFDKGEKWKRRENLQKNGATEQEIAFLLDRRVELNALPSDQLVAFIERKLDRHGIKKIIPNREQLAKAYRLFIRGRRVVDLVKKELEKKDDSNIPVPDDLERQVKTYLTKNREARWDHALAAITRMQGA
jgi:hypothetical protein